MSTLTPILFTVLFLACGAGVGSAHFALIGREAGLLVQGAPVLAVLKGRAIRLLLALGLFVAAALQGLLPLLCAMAGFMAARHVMLCRVVRQP